jgi:integrase
MRGAGNDRPNPANHGNSFETIRSSSAWLSFAEQNGGPLQATDNSWSGRRDHLLFLFLYNTGACVSKALAVRVQDVQRHDYRAGQLVGKGRKKRTGHLWKETVQHIRAWLKLAALRPDHPLLPNRFGKPMTPTASNKGCDCTSKPLRPTARRCAVAAYPLIPFGTRRPWISFNLRSPLSPSHSG